jgi:hypothetical protein
MLPLYAARIECQTASNRDPGSAWKRDPSLALGQACPGSEQEGPARVAPCPHERRSGARGRCLFAHRGKPGWHSGAVFEAPALVAGFDDFAAAHPGTRSAASHCRRSGPAFWPGPFFAFMVSFDNVVVSLFLRDARTDMSWQDLEGKLDVTIAAPSTVLIALTLLTMVIMERLAGLSRRIA